MTIKFLKQKLELKKKSGVSFEIWYLDHECQIYQFYVLGSGKKYVGCEPNADAVGKLGLEGGPAGDLADELGLCPVPLLGHSSETLVEVFEPSPPRNMSMLAVTKETVDEFLCEGTFLKDIVALAGECWFNGLGVASSTTNCCFASWVRHVVRVRGGVIYFVVCIVV